MESHELGKRKWAEGSVIGVLSLITSAQLLSGLCIIEKHR